jgi:hypothetical protein
VTDNPLIDPVQGHALHAGNFQAYAVTDAMDHIRVHIHSAGKLIFAQHSELMNVDLNQGLPANLSWGDPGTDFGHKGLDVSMASYMAELGDLASPISLHVQSAELHNQSVNSLAFISARKTERAIEVFQMMLSCCVLSLCQGADLRALEHEIRVRLSEEIKILVGRLGITDSEQRIYLEEKLTCTFSEALLVKREVNWARRVDAALDVCFGNICRFPFVKVTLPQVNGICSEFKDKVLEAVYFARGEVGLGNGYKVLAAGSAKLYDHVRNHIGMLVTTIHCCHLIIR